MNRLYNLRKSFVYAINGVAFCVRYEKNMRIHIVVTLYVLFFSRFFEFTRAELILLILTCVIVISLEMINTSIEVIVDKVSPHYHTLAKIAKDVAAGAVFVSSTAAAAIGIVLFGDIEALKKIWDCFFNQYLYLGLLIASGLVSLIFIRTGKKRKTRSFDSFTLNEDERK